MSAISRQSLIAIENMWLIPPEKCLNRTVICLTYFPPTNHIDLQMLLNFILFIHIQNRNLLLTMTGFTRSIHKLKYLLLKWICQNLCHVISMQLHLFHNHKTAECKIVLVRVKNMIWWLITSTV